MLRLINISKTYGAKTALSDVSVAFPEKGLVIVCGESGCGKTTLLNIASGADIPSSGSVLFNGRKITEADIEEYRRGYVSNIYQDFMLAEELSAGDNLRLAAQAVGKDPTSDEIAALLEKAGLNAGFSDKKVSTMSGGEKQRVAVARALIKDGASVFADEPTGNLDRKNGELIMALLKKIAEERLVVVVSHNERLNREYGQYFIELEDGCVVRSDLPEAEPNRAIREPGPKIRPKISARTVAVLAATGYRKNKLKSVFAAIAFILVFALFASVCTALIADVNLAFADSVDASSQKNALLRLSSFDNGADAESLSGIAPYTVANMENFYNINYSFPLNDLEYMIEWADGVPNVEIPYGEPPSSASQIMLPLTYAEILIDRSTYYGADDVSDLIGKTYYCGRNADVESADGSFSDSGLMRYADFEICGIFDDGLTDREAFFALASDENAEKNLTEDVVASNFMMRSAIAGSGALLRFDKLRFTSSTDLFYSLSVQEGALAPSIVYDRYSAYSASLPSLSGREIYVTESAAARYGVAAGEEIEINYGTFTLLNGLIPNINKKGSKVFTVKAVIDGSLLPDKDAELVFSEEDMSSLALPGKFPKQPDAVVFDLSNGFTYSTVRAIAARSAEISGESFSTVLLHRFEVQNAFSVSGVYDRLNESRYIIFLPCFIAFAIGLFSVGFAFFGFLLSSNDDLYAVLRAVGFDAGSVFAVMLAQLSLLCVIGVAAGLATAYAVTHLFGIYLTSNALITEVVLPLGWHAVLISTAVALLSAIATAFFKARKMFSGTIASNKSE